jgi:hypothetical protein
MQENELLKQILDAYCDARDLTPEQKSACDSFYAYAAQWIADSGVVGVGQTSDGIALRFKNGDERVFFTAVGAGIPVVENNAVSITGNSGGSVRGSAPIADASVNITG